MIWLNQIVQGVLLGGYYALIACGLSFLFSVMRVINLAHGSLAILSAYALFWLADSFSLAIPRPRHRLAADGGARLGVAEGRDRAQFAGGTAGADLSTFGLSIVIDNLLFQGFGADTRSLAPFVGTLSYDSYDVSDDIRSAVSRP